MTDPLVIEDHDRLRVLRLNRPEKKNALSGRLLHDLNQAFVDAAGDPDVWAIAITGNGTGFCSGMDFSDEGTMGAATSGRGAGRAPAPPPGDPGRDRSGAAYLPLRMRVECDKPIVAGVNGAAVGAGVAIAMNADIRIAAPSARFHPGYTRIGVSPDLGLTWTLPRAIGHERAMRFMLEQRAVDAGEALQLGLVGEVVARDEELDDRLLEVGQHVTRVAPLAARGTKRLFVSADQPADLVAHLDAELDHVLACLRTEDCGEAVRAMVTGEPPTFRGR